MDERTNAVAPDTISMYEHEEEIFRMERHNKRLFLMLLITIGILFVTNVGWICYASLYDTVTYTQDGEGINNINTGEQGDVIGDGANTENEDTQERESQRNENPQG